MRNFKEENEKSGKTETKTLANVQKISVGYMALKFYEKNTKEFYMNKALAQAKVALKKNEVPVGAIVVDEQGVVIARAYNQVELKKCHAAHAEVLAIQKACKKRNNWRLTGCTIYVTLEPCLMCLGLIQLSRLQGIVFGAQSTLFGTELLHNFRTNRPSFAKHLSVEGGIKEEASIALLRLFFSDKRQKRKVSSEIKSGIHTKNKAVARSTKK